MINEIELLASYWTAAGDVEPMGPDEVSPHSFRERAEIVGAAGFHGFGTILADVQRAEATIGYREMRRVLAGSGIKYVELEFLVDWYADGKRRSHSDKTRRDLLAAADALGARDIKIGPDFDTPTADIPRMQGCFADLCRDAAKYGADIAIEMMPWSNVRTIETARAIVEGADQPNGGIVLDIWHLARGGIAYDQIKTIPPRFIRSVEIDDAAASAVGSLVEDTIHRRLFPGAGALNPPAFINAIQATGWRGCYGVEILSSVYRKWPIKEVVQEAFDSTMRQFEKARHQCAEQEDAQQKLRGYIS